jgi:hypothetical protein
MDAQIESFLNINKTALLEIYHKELTERGEGILHIIKNVKENKLDVVYLEMNQIPEKLELDIKKKKSELQDNKSMIYIFISNEDKETLLEIEVKNEHVVEDKDTAQIST